MVRVFMITSAALSSELSSSRDLTFRRRARHPATVFTIAASPGRAARGTAGLRCPSARGLGRAQLCYQLAGKPAGAVDDDFLPKLAREFCNLS
eukprot:1080403-Pleurochrysis_carterae.AAC.1